MCEDPRVLKDLRFEYLTPEFARPDFKLPSEEDKECEWAIIGTIFQGSKLIDPEKVKAHMKGNEPMDEVIFDEETIKRLTEPEGAATRDIETYTKHALKLQLAIAAAESQLENAKKKHRKAAERLKDASQQWAEADKALDEARAKLDNHLDAVREKYATLRGGHRE